LNGQQPDLYQKLEAVDHRELPDQIFRRLNIWTLSLDGSMEPNHMQKHKKQLNLEHLCNLAWQKRFHILIPLVGALAVGLLLAFLLPKVYEARTLILVEPQQVPSEYVRAIVAQDIRSRIGTITQQIMSRSNLEKVIEKFQLFTEPQRENMFMEDKLEAMRDKISVSVSRAHGGADAFSITYRGGDPETVMQVANMLTNLFIESNLQIRQEQAQGTSNFLDEELETMREKLGRIESELQNYRQLHMGELPEQLDSNLRVLETLRIQMLERKDRLLSEQNRLSATDSEIEQLKITMEPVRRKVAPGVTAPGSPDPESATSLEQLQDEFKRLKSIYTDQHPSVIRMKKRIEDLEKEPPVTPMRSGDKSEMAGYQLYAGNPMAKLLADKLRQRAASIATINNMQEDINKIDRQIQNYQLRIERTPKREEELFALKRDYENIQVAYKSLLSRKLEADMAVNMERKKKSEQFDVLDYAKLPERPVSPNLKKIFVMALFIGLGVGSGLLIIVDFTDESIRHVNDLEESGLLILATIPQCQTSKIVRSRYMRNIYTFCSLSVVCVLTAVFAYFAMNG
jgi:polysaccharide chain length determinant protein (PEP-CTERM system associated)